MQAAVGPVHRQRQRIRAPRRLAIAQRVGQVQRLPVAAVLVGLCDAFARELVVGHVHLQIGAGLVFRAGRVPGLEHDLAQERGDRHDPLHRGVVFGPQVRAARDLDLHALLQRQIAGETIAELQLALAQMRAIRRSRRRRRGAAVAHLAQAAALAASAVGRQLQIVARQRHVDAVAGGGFDRAQFSAVRRIHRQLARPAPALGNELAQMEARHQQPHPGQGQPQAADAGPDHQRVVEIGAAGVVHDVQHPEHVEHAPGRIAMRQHFAGLRRQVHGGAIGVVEVHPPRTSLVGARFLGPIQQHRRLGLARTAVGRHRQRARERAVDRQGASVAGIEQTLTIAVGDPIDRLVQQPRRGDRLRRRRPFQHRLRRHRVGRPCALGRRMHAELVSLHLVVRQQAHDQSARHPQDELQADRQPEPFVNPAHPRRHALRLQRKL